VLLVAEHASAIFGGEAFLPLHYFRVLRARGVEVWLLCHGRVERELREVFPDAGERMRFVPDLWIHRLLSRLEGVLPGRLGVGIFGSLSHLVTQLLIRREARALVRRERIDVVHEPIPVSPKQPSALHDVGAPVVIGPMNGGMGYPPGFAHFEGRFERASLGIGRWLANALNWLIPGKRRAALLLVSNARTRDALPGAVAGVPVLEVVENGVDLARFERGGAARTRPAGAPLRVAFVGRLIPLKVVDLLLAALARHGARHASELDVLGDGEERPRLEALARELGIAERVRFHGFVPQPRVARALREVDVLVLPSIHECGGAVVLEAMAMGLPVIAARWGGPADYLDESCGMLVEPANPEALVAGLSAALDALAADPERCRALGAAGRAKVEALYDWERKIDAMLAIYARVIAGARP
jgi:glycosyltransferase involved in cell wall biosynthesis